MNASLLGRDTTDNTTLELAPVEVLDPGCDAPCQQWPENPGPGVPGENWAQDDVINIPGKPAANLPAADEINFPPLVIDIYDKETGERVAVEALPDTDREVFCDYFNAKSENCIAIPRQPGAVIPPLVEGSEPVDEDEDELSDCLNKDCRKYAPQFDGEVMLRNGQFRCITRPDDDTWCEGTWINIDKEFWFADGAWEKDGEPDEWDIVSPWPGKSYRILAPHEAWIVGDEFYDFVLREWIDSREPFTTPSDRRFIRRKLVAQ